MDQDHQHQNKLGHILTVSPPLQGHATPILKYSHKMAELGMKVTFLSMDLVDAKSRDESWSRGLRVISVPSGLEAGGWWKEQGKLMERIHTVLPSYMEEFLSRDGCDDGVKISGVIVDSTLSWMLEIPKKMGIKAAVYWCSNAGCLALGFKIPHLLQTNYIDEDGKLSN